MNTRALMVVVLLGSSQNAVAKLGDAATEVTTAGSILQMLFGLLVVLAVLVGGALLLRRMGNFPSTTDSPLRIVTGLALSPRDRLVVVQVGSKQVLLGLSPGRIQTLHVLEEPLEINPQSPPSLGGLSQRFSALLQNHMKKMP